MERPIKTIGPKYIEKFLILVIIWQTQPLVIIWQTQETQPLSIAAMKAQTHIEIMLQ
jgi:hypothetical protein